MLDQSSSCSTNGSPSSVKAQQLLKINNIHQAAQSEETILERVLKERKQVLSAIVGDTWKSKAFKSGSNLDPLLAKKFRTRTGLSGIRLEKLLLELDNVETLSDEELRARRKQEVQFVQSLLQKADELNQKANRMVQFQERVGKESLRTLLEASPRRSSISDVEKKDSEMFESPRKRRFASTDLIDVKAMDDESASVQAAENPAEATTGMEVEKEEEEPLQMTREEESPIPPGEEMVVETKDSADDLRKVQEEMDEKAAAYYRAAQQTVSPQVPREETSASSSIDNGQAKSSPKHSAEKTSSSPRAPAAEKSMISDPDIIIPEPKVSIEELPRAFVMLVHDVHARKARVSLDRENVLTIAIPGRSDYLKYSLGSDINMNAITKEVQGNHQLKIILPKLYAFPMRVGRAYAETRTMPLRVPGDFWSRF